MLHKEVVIIGGGISGLTAAYQLNNNSDEFILLESADKTGGVIETVHEKKYTFENGPNTFLLNDKRIYNIFKKLNLKIQDASPNSKNRYVLKNKKCIKVPILFHCYSRTPYDYSTHLPMNLISLMHNPQ